MILFKCPKLCYQRRLTSDRLTYIGQHFSRLPRLPLAVFDFWLSYRVARMRRCVHPQCMKFASYNLEGSKTAVFCKQHSEDGMVNVISLRCSHVSCTRQPSFNAEGSRTAAFCKQHAEDGMVNIRITRCSHDSCM